MPGVSNGLVTTVLPCSLTVRKSAGTLACALPSQGAHGPLAQLAEQGTFNPKVVGSKPTRPTSS